VLDTVLRAVHARRRELNVTHWELFALRDDYCPKPAFEQLRQTLADLRRAGRS
jgi:hypothetical protein